MTHHNPSDISSEVEELDVAEGLPPSAVIRLLMPCGCGHVNSVQSIVPLESIQSESNSSDTLQALMVCLGALHRVHRESATT